MAVLLFCDGSAAGQELPWTVLVPAHDSRDPEMRAWDEAESRKMTEIVNQSEEFATKRFQWSRVSILNLLKADIPFAELCFDSVHPADFTPAEKSVLTEWLLRGGFLLAFEDAYPYEQEEFRKKRNLPVFDFFTQALPAANSHFTVQRADDTHPIFHALHDTQTVPSVRREMQENPNYRGRTILLYDGQVVAFFMGRYNYQVDGRWVPLSRPFFSSGFHSELRSYYLILNVYVYALLR